MDTKDEILNVMQAAELLQLRKTTMYKLLKSPVGPKFTKIGRRRVILRSSLYQWISDNEGKADVM